MPQRRHLGETWMPMSHPTDQFAEQAEASAMKAETGVVDSCSLSNSRVLVILLSASFLRLHPCPGTPLFISFGACRGGNCINREPGEEGSTTALVQMGSSRHKIRQIAICRVRNLKWNCLKPLFGIVKTKIKRQSQNYISQI